MLFDARQAPRLVGETRYLQNPLRRAQSPSPGLQALWYESRRCRKVLEVRGDLTLADATHLLCLEGDRLPGGYGPNLAIAEATHIRHAGGGTPSDTEWARGGLRR